MPFEKQLEELARRRARAVEMGGPEKVQRQHDRGSLTARERIDRLLDPGSFLEVGMLNHSDMPGMEEKTPADSKIAGHGKIDGRLVSILSNDFTVVAATSSRIAGRKEGELKVLSARRGHPVIFPVRLYSELYNASDDVGARAVVWAHKNEVVEVPCEEEGVVLDIDDRATFDKVFPPD